MTADVKTDKTHMGQKESSNMTYLSLWNVNLLIQIITNILSKLLF